MPDLIQEQISINDNETTVMQRIAFLDRAASKMRREADEAEARLLLTPADEHLNRRRIALGKLADGAEQAAQRLREVAKADRE